MSLRSLLPSRRLPLAALLLSGLATSGGALADPAPEVSGSVHPRRASPR